MLRAERKERRLRVRAEIAEKETKVSGVKDASRPSGSGGERGGTAHRGRGGPAPAGSSVQVEGETHPAQNDHPQGKRSDRTRPGGRRKDHRPRGIRLRTESLAGPR